MKKNKQIPWNKGKKLPPLSEEHKEKIRKTMKEKNRSGKNNPFYGRKHTEETKKKISKASKGKNNPNWGKRGEECCWYSRKQSKEELEMRSKLVSGKKNPMYGKTPWNKGLNKEIDSRVKSTSDKLKGRFCTWGDKISKTRTGKYAGKNHPNWQGGLKDNPYGIKFNETLREEIRKRDNRQCILCGERDEDRKLQVHHIDYNKTNNDRLNLVSLCLRCHLKTNYKRKSWTSKFKSYISSLSK